MPDIVKGLMKGGIIGIAAWAVSAVAASYFAVLGGFAIVGIVAIGYVAADMVGL